MAALYGAGLWELDTDPRSTPNAHGSSVPQRWFDEHQPRSGLVTAVYELVRDSTEARTAAVRALTETYFVDADPTGLLNELGLSGPRTGSPAEAVLNARAAEYRRLSDRVDVFWSGRDGTRANRTSADLVRSLDARQAVPVRSEGRCETPGCTGDIGDLTDSGDPILEIDHIHDLAKGGPDNPVQMMEKSNRGAARAGLTDLRWVRRGLFIPNDPVRLLRTLAPTPARGACAGARLGKWHEFRWFRMTMRRRG